MAIALVTIGTSSRTHVLGVIKSPRDGKRKGGLIDPIAEMRRRINELHRMHRALEEKLQDLRKRGFEVAAYFKEEEMRSVGLEIRNLGDQIRKLRNEKKKERQGAHLQQMLRKRKQAA